MKKIILSVLLLSVFLVGMVASVSAADTLFEDDFSSEHPLNGGTWFGIYPESPSSEDLNDDIYSNNDLSFECDLSGCGDYYMVTKDDAGAVIGLDTTSLENIEVSFNWRTASVSSSDDIEVAYRIGGSGSWDNVFSDGTTNDWTPESLVLPLDAENEDLVQVMFWLNDGDSDYAIWDGIVITGENEAPTVDVHETTPGYPGANEFDEKVKILVNYNDNSVVADCEIDWGDSKTSSCPATGGQKSHQYDDSGEYTVTVTVEDGIGNTATDSMGVEVANVVPTVDEIVASGMSGTTPANNIFAMGEVITFDAINVWDVVADLGSLVYTWDFDGTGVQAGTDEDPTFVYSEASSHTVTLYLTDKDGGISETVELEIEIEEPEEMSPMQGAVIGETFKFDLDEPWNVGTGHNKKFETDLISPVTCDAIVAPVGMAVSSLGNTKCKVTWTPATEQKGEHHVIVRASDGTDYKYYSFDVTVYSWGIELASGWNLVSIPYMPADTSINEVLGGIIENVAYEGTSTYTIYQYDGLEDKWFRARKYSTNSGYTATSSKLTDVVPGYGYWIKMENTDTLYGVEDNFPVSTVPGETGVDLATESWNLIGRFGASPLSLGWSTALESLRKPFYADHYVSPTLGIYKLDSVTASGDTTWSATTALELAQGYWVRTAAGSESRTSVRYEPDTI